MRCTCCSVQPLLVARLVGFFLTSASPWHQMRNKWHTCCSHTHVSVSLWSSVKLVRPGGWDTGNGSPWRYVHLPRALSSITGCHMDDWARSIFALSLLARGPAREAAGGGRATLIRVLNICVMRPCYLRHHAARSGCLCAVTAWRRGMSVLCLLDVWFVISRSHLSAPKRSHTGSFMSLDVSVSGSGPCTFHNVCLCGPSHSWRRQGGSCVTLGLIETLQTTFSCIRQGQGYQSRG